MILDPETKYLLDQIKPYISREKLRGNPKKLVYAELNELLHRALDEIYTTEYQRSENKS